MTVITKKRFTIDEYHKLIEMTAKGTPHTFATTRLCRQLDRLLSDRVVVRCQEPIILPSDSEPDAVIANGNETDYLANHPFPEDILLIVEVFDSTLNYDQTTKLSLYAEDGIANYWIVNLNARQLECHSLPYQDVQGKYNYLNKQIYLPNQSVTIPQFQDAVLDLSKIFP